MVWLVSKDADALRSEAILQWYCGDLQFDGDDERL